MPTLFFLSWLIGVCLSVQVHQTPPALLRRPGDKVQLVCSHEKTDYNLMYWYQKSPGDRALKRIGHVYYSSIEHEESFKEHFKITGDMSGSTAKNGSLFILDLKAPEHSAVYYCAARQGTTNTQPAYFGQGTKLTVLERDPIPPKVKVLKPSPKECRNKNKTLVCVASKFYPDHVSVSWKLNGENINKSVATDNNALKQDDGSYTITSRLRVSAEKWYTPDNNFTCTVHFNSWNHTVDESASVSGVEAPGGRNITRDHYLRVTNAAKLSYGVFIARSCIYGAFVAFLVWKLQGSTGKQNN